MIILGAHQDGNCRLIKASPLPVPLLDTVEGAFPRQVKHEQDSHGVVAHQGQHVDKLALTTQIPNGKGDFGISDGNGLFHEVDAQSLNIVFVPAALDIFDHEGGFAYLGIAHHSDLDDDMVPTVLGLIRPLPIVAVSLMRRVGQATGGP